MQGQIPSEKSRAARIALAVFAGALGTMLVAGGLWMAFRPEPAPVPRQETFEPAEETSRSADTTTASPAAPATPAAEPSATPPASGPGKPAPLRVHRIAYRLGERIWVADEDGTDAVAVAPGGYEVYELSPDGRQLAVVAPAMSKGSGRIALYDAIGKGMRFVGEGAYADQLSWSPDSAWLAYNSGSGERSSVRRVHADGSRDAEIAKPAALPVVSPDARYVACTKANRPGEGDPLQVVNVTTGTSTALKDASRAFSWSWGPEGDLYFSRPGAGGGNVWELWRTRAPFTTSERLGSLDLRPPAYALLDLAVSPDGTRVLASSAGDDDYSRLVVFDVRSLKFSPIETRRDASACCWLDDGSGILYFEGNDYQGEKTALVRSTADGGKRTVVVRGARR